MFQFPSNGKAYPKNAVSESRTPNCYKFQFPSNGKAYPKLVQYRNTPNLVEFGFNSLQTGKHIQRGASLSYDGAHPLFQFPSNGKAYPKGKGSPNLEKERVFQFPSNGKAYPKFEASFFTSKSSDRVSIPFKRESISKDTYSEIKGLFNEISFNSLQTGKHIQSIPTTELVSLRATRFNSLQTGKHIQSQ